LPEFHSNDVLGDSISQELFIPIGKSADVTLLGAYYSQAGFGFGGEGRLIPNRKGAARLRGFYIDDKVSQRSPGVLWGKRYNVNYNQTQDFRNGFRMAADVNMVSDFSYYSDFERDLNLISTPAVLQRIEFSRNGKWASVNAREYRRAQFLGTVIDPVSLELEESSLLQQTLPEIEWRGRSNRLGRSPFYLQYEASLASIQQREMNVFSRPRFDADYLRGDAFPTISIPWAPAPWIDITPRFTYRYTYYTQKQELIDNPLDDPDDGIPPSQVRSVVDDTLSRQLWGANLLLVGPKVNRIFGKTKSKQYKHAIEPRLTYGYGEAFFGADDIIRFDEVDVFNGAGNAMSYALVNRLFVKRPRDVAPAGAVGDETIMMPDGTVDEAGLPSPIPEGPPGGDRGGAPPPTESVEIASIEIAQRRSFDQSLSVATIDGEFQESRFGDVLLTGRYNPNPNTSLDIRSSYDVLWKTITGATLSGGVRRRLAQLRFSLVWRNGLAGQTDDTQLRFTSGFSFLRGKLRFVVDGTVDFDPEPNAITQEKSFFPNRAWRIQYSTQCCTMYFERLDRTYSLSERQDFYFRIDLKGIGKILQVTY
jgi:hypothetical protein